MDRVYPAWPSFGGTLAACQKSIQQHKADVLHTTPGYVQTTASCTQLRQTWQAGHSAPGGNRATSSKICKESEKADAHMETAVNMSFRQLSLNHILATISI